MIPHILEEEAKLDAMQRHWQLRRGTSSSTLFFEEFNETEDMLAPPMPVIYTSLNFSFLFYFYTYVYGRLGCNLTRSYML